MKLLELIKAVHNDFVASVSKRLRTKEVVRVLSLAHAKELSETPIENWNIKIQEQKDQIAAVMAGKLDIVDRRSWQFPYLPESLHRLNVPILKNTPYNLRRFAETPIPRRAINLIKNSIIMSLRWEIRPVTEVNDLTPEIEKRIRIATEVLTHPNRQDSFRSFWEQVIEDIIMGGYGAIEPRLTPDYKRPLLLWPIDGSTIRIYADWTEATSDIKPRYAQMTGLKGERGIIAFYDKEIIYIRDNKRSSTPFGLGSMEIAFNVINYFLGSQDAAGKAGADQIHKTMLWWNSAQQSANMQSVRRYITNELEGQSKISLLSGMQKPEVVDIKAVTPEDLLLEWQEFQIKIIAAAFNISPLALNMTQDVNKAVGKVMSDADFQSSVVPMATRVQDSITYEILHKRLGWKDLEFAFIGLEDPDPLTKVNILQKKYMMNCRTPDEMREEDGLPPLAGGWGRLTSSQYQIIVAEAMAQSRAAGMGGGGGMGMPGGAGGMGSMRMPGGGSSGGGMYGAGFTSDDIMNMTPEDIQYLQEQGLLPETDDLSNQMEDQQPGILKTLTQELKEFFDVTDQMEEEGEAQTEPEPISNKDQKEQLIKYKRSQHKPTFQETAMNRRYSDTANKDKQFQKATSRYPRELTPEDRKALRK